MYVEYYTLGDDTSLQGYGLTVLDLFVIPPVIYDAPEGAQPSDCVWMVPNT